VRFGHPKSTAPSSAPPDPLNRLLKAGSPPYLGLNGGPPQKHKADTPF